MQSDSVKSTGGGAHVDQQTQTPGGGVSVALRDQLRNASRNIKNRWSSSGADGTTAVGMGGVMGGSEEEQQSLLGGAADQPHDTPQHRPSSQLDMMNRNIHPSDPPPSYGDPPPPASSASGALPSTSQLQRAINQTLRSNTSGPESKMLSTQADPLTSFSSSGNKRETFC